MMEKLREQVSALADDELPAGEHELLTRRFAAEKYLSICWERYHLIGEAMRKALPHVDTRGFADRIMAALDEEPGEEKRRSLGGYFGRIAAGVAVAASVAVVALIGLRHDGARMQSASAPSEIVPQALPLQTRPVAYGMVNNADWNGNSPEVQAELNNYIINHNEISAVLSQQDMLPYFYIATYATRAPRHAPTSAGQQAVPRHKQ
ncbi:MAG: sigma-E factor negative regulatory protein [Gammaproteobacteria bacterium]